MKIKGQPERTFPERLALIPNDRDVIYGLVKGRRWYAYYQGDTGCRVNLYLGMNTNPQVAQEMEDRTKITCWRGHELFFFWCPFCHEIEQYERTGRPIAFGKAS